MTQSTSRFAYRLRRGRPSLSRRKSSGGRGGNRRGAPNRGNRSATGSHGIHHRRDKRWPFYATQVEETIPAESPEAAMTPAGVQAVATSTSVAMELPGVDMGRAGIDPLAEKALTLWLRWNEAYEKVTACMFQPGQDRQQMEDLVDQLDQMRLRAVQLSGKIVH